MAKRIYTKNGFVEKVVSVEKSSTGTEFVDTETFDNRTKKQIQHDNFKDRKKELSDNVSNGIGILRFITLIILMAFLSRLLFPVEGGVVPTFQSLLTKLSQAPIVDNSFFNGLRSLQIKGDWAIFDGLRTFINSISSLVSFGVWCTLGLVNVASMLLWFVGWIFGF